jgi:hypothetical protein
MVLFGEQITYLRFFRVRNQDARSMKYKQGRRCTGTAVEIEIGF